MVLLTAARGMHEFFRSEIYCPCRSEPQQTELIKSNSQKNPLLGTCSASMLIMHDLTDLSSVDKGDLPLVKRLLKTLEEFLQLYGAWNGSEN